MDGRQYGSATRPAAHDGEYNALFDSSVNRTPPPLPAVEEAPEPPEQRRLPRALLVFLLASVVFITLACGAVFLTVQQLTGNIPRVPNVFTGLDDANRPAPVADRVSFLVMGTDSAPGAATPCSRWPASTSTWTPAPHGPRWCPSPATPWSTSPTADQRRSARRTASAVPRCSCGPSSSSPTTASTTSRSSITPGSSTWSTLWAASTSRARTWTVRRHWPTSARAPPTRPSTATGSPTSRPPSAR